MAKFAINASGAILLPSLVQVSESISGSVVPLAMFVLDIARKRGRAFCQIYAFEVPMWSQFHLKLGPRFRERLLLEVVPEGSGKSGLSKK